MSNLLASLRMSTDALGVFGRVLDVTQNNVGNASTPGYAKQALEILPRSFDPDAGTAGGIQAGPMVSARDEFAEQNVRRQLENQGRADMLQQILQGVEANLPVADGQGLAGAMSGLFESFSAWSMAPNDTTARENVLNQARALAQSFGDAAAGLANSSRDGERQVSDCVDQINALAGKLRDYNVQVRQGARNDAGLDANIHVALENLSELADVTAIKTSDGSFTVLMGGSIPLVIGDHQYPIGLKLAHSPDASPSYPDGPVEARIQGAAGADVTGRIKGGKLGGALDARNRVIPGLLGDGSQAGDLNRLAAALADRINGILSAGRTADGEAGTDLFVYDDTNATASAKTLAVNPDITSEALAPVDPGPPMVSNGASLRLAGLSEPQGSEDTVDGKTGYVAFFASMAARVGNELATAHNDYSFQQQSVAQARNLRNQTSGVSLDEEAMLLIQYQRAYEAAAKMISVISDLTETVVNLLQ